MPCFLQLFLIALTRALNLGLRLIELLGVLLQVDLGLLDGLHHALSSLSLALLTLLALLPQLALLTLQTLLPSLPAQLTLLILLLLLRQSRLQEGERNSSRRAGYEETVRARKLRFELEHIRSSPGILKIVCPA